MSFDDIVKFIDSKSTGQFSRINGREALLIPADNWNEVSIVLKNESNIGEDNLKLFFEITKSADLLVKCFDINDEFLGEYNLVNIF